MSGSITLPRTRGRLEVLGAPSASIPHWTMTWCDRAGFDLVPGPTLPGSAVEPGPTFRGWSQVAVEIATATAGGSAVLVNRPAWPGAVARRVVAALGGLPDDREVLADAAGCAAALHATLVLVHAVPVSFAERSVGLDAALAHARTVLAAGTSLLADTCPGVRVTARLVRARPHELVTEKTDADLVVVGGAAIESPRDLGLVTLSAIQHAPCPVLVTPRTPRSPGGAGP